jgi:tetratricopeptide (TPR) repeat protein
MRTHNSALGINYWFGWVHLLNPDPNGLERASQLERPAIALDDSLSAPHSILAGVYVQKGQYDQAVIEAERGIALNPNLAESYFWLADVMNNMVRPAEALEYHRCNTNRRPSRSRPSGR